MVGGPPLGSAQVDALGITSGVVGLPTASSPFVKAGAGAGEKQKASRGPLSPAAAAATSIVLHKTGLYRIDVVMEVRSAILYLYALWLVLIL